jgi:hypothetical protein
MNWQRKAVQKAFQRYPQRMGKVHAFRDAAFMHRLM